MPGRWLFRVHTGRRPRLGPSCAAAYGRPRARRVRRPPPTTYCARWVPAAGNSDAESAARPKHRPARNHAGQVGPKKPLPAESEPRSSQTPARPREPGGFTGSANQRPAFEFASWGGQSRAPGAGERGVAEGGALYPCGARPPGRANGSAGCV